MMMLKCCVYICSSILSDTNIGYKPLTVAGVTTSSLHITMDVTRLQTVYSPVSFLQTSYTQGELEGGTQLIWYLIEVSNLSRSK